MDSKKAMLITTKDFYCNPNIKEQTTIFTFKTAQYL